MYAWKRACLQARCYYMEKTFLFAKTELHKRRISWSVELLYYYFTFAFLVKGNNDEEKRKTFLSSSRFCSSQETLNVTKKQNWHQPWLYDIHLQGVPKKNVLTFLVT